MLLFRWQDAEVLAGLPCRRRKRYDNFAVALPANRARRFRCRERGDNVQQSIPFDARPSADQVFVARRNNSLSSTGRWWIFRFILAFSTAIALGFVAIGAWPVMPFTGLEMVVLYAAFRYIDRHASDYEILKISGDRVRIETRVGSQVKCVEFNRQWAQLVTNDRSGAPRLALRSHGREFAFGSHLGGADLERVARELRQHLRRAS